MKTKEIHSVVTKLAFKNYKKDVRGLYRSVFKDMAIQDDGIKGSKIRKVMQSGRLTEFLTSCLSKTRKQYMLGTKLTEPEPYKYKINGIRHYSFADGSNYPSVTAIIKNGQDSGAFDPFKNWEKTLIDKHGIKKGERKRNIASKIGDYTHAQIELFLRGGLADKNLVRKSLAKHIEPFLDNIDQVLGCELPVFSKRGYAGTVDCLAKLKDGTIAIIDWKTSNAKRTKSNTVDYKCQSAAYALAVYEMYGIKVDSIILAVMYKKTHGKRKPTRHDIIIETDIRQYLDIFLEKLEVFNRRETELNLDCLF